MDDNRPNDPARTEQLARLLHETYREAVAGLDLRPRDWDSLAAQQRDVYRRTARVLIDRGIVN